MVTPESKRVFSSTNGAAWTEVTTLGDNVIVLINGFSDRLWVLWKSTESNISTSVKTERIGKLENTADNLILERSPGRIPYRKHIHHPDQHRQWCREGGSGRNAASQRKETTPWFSLDGKGWASLANTMYDTYCPGMDNPAIMYYGGMFYCFGGELDAIYSSITGIAWSKTETKFLLPRNSKEKARTPL